MRKLEGKSAIVTGANRGIGAEIMTKFAMEGCNVWACARKESDEFFENAKKLEKDFNVEITPVFFELTNENEIKNAFKEIYKSKRQIDILVNAAGVVNTDLFQITPMNEMRNVFDINFFGPIFLTQLVLKSMVRSKTGSIINISSIAGLDVNPTNCTYGSSKAALIHFTKILASELGAFNIRVNAVAPGPTNTDMVKKVGERIGEDIMLSRCALSRIAEPIEVANVVSFLASDESSFINGQVIRVDGGAK